MGKPRAFEDYEVAELRDIFWGAAITYPRHILKRRLGFLTQAEVRRVRALYKQIEALQDQIDEIALKAEDIVAERAEVVKDPWR